jgi:N-methylhydantoinase B
VIRGSSGGGGGFGNPAERDPELVRADVRDRQLSAEAAASAYGVQT